jgi:hypothetical protein
MPLKRLDATRIQFERTLTFREVEQLVSDRDVRTLQCSSPVESSTWDLLNRILFAERSKIELRVYGF